MATVKRAAVIGTAAVFLILAAVLVGQVHSRPVDRDEGFWLYVPWRLTAGEVPYRDFAFPHMPGGALYYAALTTASRPSLYFARNFNAVLVLATVALVSTAFVRRGEREEAAAFAVLYVGSSLVLTWAVPVKAYAPACAAVAVATAAAIWPTGPKPKGLLRALIMGAAVGAAAAVRLQALVLLPAGAVAIWFGHREKRFNRIPILICYTAGFLIFTPAVLYFFVKTGDAFLFNVWTVHTLFLGQNGFPGGRLDAFVELITAADVVLLAAFALASLRSANAPVALGPFTFAAVLALVNFLPGSAQGQYFVLAVAPAAAAGAVGLAALYRRRARVAVLLIGIYAVFGAARPAARILFDRAHKDLVGPAEVYKAAELLRTNADPDETVYTTWPGYAALAERRVMPGWELGYFTHRIASRCDESTRREYRLVTYDETAEHLAAGEFRYVLLGIDAPVEVEKEIAEYYKAVGRAGGATLYEIARR